MNQLAQRSSVVVNLASRTTSVNRNRTYQPLRRDRHNGVEGLGIHQASGHVLSVCGNVTRTVPTGHLARQPHASARACRRSLRHHRSIDMRLSYEAATEDAASRRFGKIVGRSFAANRQEMLAHAVSFVDGATCVVRGWTRSAIPGFAIPLAAESPREVGRFFASLAHSTTGTRHRLCRPSCSAGVPRRR